MKLFLCVAIFIAISALSTADEATAQLKRGAHRRHLQAAAAAAHLESLVTKVRGRPETKVRGRPATKFHPRDIGNLLHTASQNFQTYESERLCSFANNLYNQLEQLLELLNATDMIRYVRCHKKQFDKLLDHFCDVVNGNNHDDAAADDTDLDCSDFEDDNNGNTTEGTDDNGDGTDAVTPSAGWPAL